MTIATLRWLAGEQIVNASPCFVVEETSEHAALFQPAGTLWRRSTGTRGGPRGRNMLPEGWDGGHELLTWAGDGVLRMHRFGEPWSVWRWLDSDRRWSDDFYVNLEDPWRRTAIGFDSGDWILDVVARADGDWHYKDEDELAWAESAGVVDADWVERTRDAGRRAVAWIEAGEWPLHEDWDRWLPDASPELPTLPDDWATVGGGGTGA
jgi:hypothetical protein